MDAWREHNRRVALIGAHGLVLTQPVVRSSTNGEATTLQTVSPFGQAIDTVAVIRSWTVAPELPVHSSVRLVLSQCATVKFPSHCL